MSEWKEVQLKDVVSILGDGLHGTPEYSNDGDYYFINGNNFSQGSIVINDDTKRVSHSEYLKYKKELNDRTLFVSINGTLGNVAYYKGEKVVLGKSACYFNLLDNVDKRFIRYMLSTPYFKNYVQTYANGTTIKNVSLKSMREFPFKIPILLKEQKQIADIISCLDNKIDNLRRQNETLEKIAQTLFKHWFIDFEFPNDEGKPYKSSGGAMVASELGDIPEGWRVGQLADVVDVFTGYPFKSDLYSLKNGIKVVRGENVSLGFLRWDMEKRWEYSLESYQSYLLNSNDYVIGMDGSRVGKNRCIVFESDLPLILAQRVARLRAFKRYFQSYINIFLMQVRFEKYVDFVKTGTSIPHISGKQIKDFECLIPSEKTVSNFDDFYNRWFLKFDNNKKQIQTLTQIRDTLLPKLMSGQIRVKN
jgi:type I restriction enzyme S subunit